MNLILAVLGLIVGVLHAARIRVGCVRHGHALLCISDGHVCARCGRFW